MLEEKRKERASKTLSYLLRHSRDFIDLNGGWADTDVIVEALSRKYPGFSQADLEDIVATDQKGRYCLDGTRRRIRANQGHSVPGVVIEMERPEPPEFLYHGTADRFLDSILAQGLRPMSRQFVHISPDVETALKVGRRHGMPVILRLRSKDFVRDGHVLMRSANGVWQAEFVPPEYLSVLELGTRGGRL
ncbi:MAG: RNA 2'-phosphotransferase [Oscillospiraceae bacterium]|nr:RNA 2'-phosphotransferase [Oscillospiraceae bacterium]